MDRKSSSEAAWALLTEGVASARLEAHGMRHLVIRGQRLVEASPAKEHLYQVAGDLITSIPGRLSRLERILDRTSLALSKMGESYLSARLPLDDQVLVEEAVESPKRIRKSRVEHLARLWMQKQALRGFWQRRNGGYSKPVEDLAGVRTFVTGPNIKGLPSTTSKSPQYNYMERPGVPPNRQQALPLPPNHSPNREREMSQCNGPAYNTPGASDEAPGERSLSVDKVRTKSKPGEEYGHPYLDHGPAGIKGRRPLQSGLDEPFPHPKQRQQGGQAEKYYKDYYRKHKGR